MVGTVIDQNMEDEIRVTVVATGIGNGEQRPKEEAVTLVARKPSEDELDYKRFERPTVIRNLNDDNGAEATKDSDADYLDIPAFLRRQADYRLHGAHYFVGIKIELSMRYASVLPSANSEPC